MRFSVTAAALFATAVAADYGYGYGYAPGTNETTPSASPVVEPSPYESPVLDYTTTEVVTSYETYCPGPTTITEGSSTYTVTEATTLTITDCPCTLTHT